MPEILHRPSSRFIHSIPDVQSHLDSIQESRMSSKTPWRMLLRLKGECPIPVDRGAWNFALSFFNVYNVILDFHSHLDSTQESRMSSKTPWRTLWRLKGECPLPVDREAWNFAHSFFNVYTCHLLSPKSSKLHKGIKNVLQASLEDVLETHRRMPLPVHRGNWIFHRASLLFIHVTFDVHSHVNSMQESRMSFQDALDSHWRMSSSPALEGL